MGLSLKDQVRAGAVLFLFLMLAGMAGRAAQKPVRQIGKPESSSTGNGRPQIINADTNPTLRFPIARMGHMNATISFGWLDISRTSIRYHVEHPPEKSQDSFEVSPQQIRKLDFQGLFLAFSNPKIQRIFYLPPNEWESLGSGMSIVSAAEGGVEATREIEQAIRNFDLALSLARPPAPAPVEVAQRPVAPPPQPEPVLHAAAPGMVLASPAVTDGKQTVEVDASPLVIRGAVMDSSGIPVVTVNGLPANIRPLNNQAVEFWSDPLPLHPGANPILLSAANSSHAETRMILTINYIPKATLVNPRALDKEALISLLAGSVPPSRVAQIVKERGLKFTPTSDDLNEIRAAGGNEELIQAIQKATVPPK